MELEEKEGGTADPETQVDPNEPKETETHEDTTEQEPSTTEEEEKKQEASSKKEESFIDPSQLPEELKPHWKRMHRSYTKRLEEIKSVKDKAAMVDRFNTDSEFAIQTIQSRAAQLGIGLTKAQAADIAQSGASTNGGAPAEFIKAMEDQLEPELKWAAKSLASSVWTANQMALEPMKKKNIQERDTQRAEEYEQLSEKLTGKAPGWEEHEDDMLELLDFVKSEKMSHKRFGSKLELLHNLVTSNASAIKEATRRMSEAGRNRTSTGTTSRTSSPNIEDRVKKAKTNQEAWDIAAKHALEELQAR